MSGKSSSAGKFAPGGKRKKAFPTDEFLPKEKGLPKVPRDRSGDADESGGRGTKRPRTHDDDDEEVGPAGPVVKAEAEDDDIERGGFASAFQKVMKRTILPAAAAGSGAGAGDVIVPVMAKRRTAALKLSNLEKKAAKDASKKKRQRKASKLAHLADPAEMPIENELKLKKLATKGVVALFNAITKHQKALAAAQAQAVAAAEGTAATTASSSGGGAGGRSFLELLRQTAQQVAEGGSKAKPAASAAPASAFVPTGAGGANGGKWSVMDDDYLETREGDEPANEVDGIDDDSDNGRRGGKGGKKSGGSAKSKRQAAAEAAAKAASAVRGGKTELPDILGDSSDDD